MGAVLGGVQAEEAEVEKLHLMTSDGFLGKLDRPCKLDITS
jgi:hypothetical protein